MSLASFSFTDRARPFVELGIGDSRIPGAAAVWDAARWDDPGALWAGNEPTWIDVTCEAFEYRVEYGRRRTTDRFVAGVGTILLDNSSGWADPDVISPPHVLTVRPGRAVRVGVDHAVYGRRVLFRGFVDAVIPTYSPSSSADTVELALVDALGEVNRAKTVPVDPPVGAGDSVDQRINRLLDLASWSSVARDLEPTGDTLIPSALGGQMADLLGQAADSGGGSVFGDLEGQIVYRPRDWQTFVPGTPVDGTIGNVDPSDVYPVSWERPFARADMATRVIAGRDPTTAVVVDDVEAQTLYGIEPFERTDLLTESDARIQQLAERYLRTRSAATSPRVRAVALDARTSVAALDLMATVEVYRPSRYRCRLELERGLVFDEELFATGVVFEVRPKVWTLALNLDSAAPYAAPGGRWDGARWDQATWADAALVLAELEELLSRIEVTT